MSYKKTDHYDTDTTLNLQNLYQNILKELGEDANREGLQKTPERVAKAMQFLTQGYQQDAVSILNSAKFNEVVSEMVIVKDIELYSLCEHHLLPFIGKAHIAYIPNEKILGLSKFVRIVHAFSNRLQLQERMTKQICNAIMEHLNPLGIAVHLSAQHYCMIMRGVKQAADVDTFEFAGIFSEENYQNKFLQLIK